MTSADKVFRLERVGKVFQTDEIDTHALCEIDLEIERGEYVAISGPSGCGKSTLLGILGLLEAPTTGRCFLKQRDVSELDATERAFIRNREIGFIFQSFNLLGELTVLENVELPLGYRGLSKRERRRRADEVLERVGMTARRNHYPAQLSGGQQQRVAVARALGGRPALLLADEPTGNLDSKSGQAVMALLDELHLDGATICIVTHDPRFAANAGRTIQMFDGRVVGQDLSEDPSENPSDPSDTNSGDASFEAETGAPVLQR